MTTIISDEEIEYSTHRKTFWFFFSPAVYPGKPNGEMKRKWKSADSARNAATK